MKTRAAIMVSLAIACGVEAASSQQPANCPEPRSSVDELAGELQEMAWQARDVAGLLGRALAPGEAPNCPVLRSEIDLQTAAESLALFVVEQDDPALAAGYFAGLRSALRRVQGHGSLRPPMNGLRAAVEADAAGVLGLLRRTADLPEIRGYLLELMRAERGPAARPDLPVELVRAFMEYPNARSEALRDALRRDPGLVRNPAARCWLERASATRSGRGRCQ